MNTKSQLKLPGRRFPLYVYPCFALLFLFISMPAYSQSTRYVSTSGSDTGNNCSVIGSPCASIQHAIDTAAVNDTVLVASGSYTEEITINSNTFGLVIDKPISLLGVDGSNNPITDYNQVQATIISGSESSFGTNFYVTASDVTIQGLRFEAVAGSVDPESPANSVNKAFEITSDNFTMEHSVVDAMTGYNFDGRTSTSIYFGDEDPDDLNNFTVNANRLYGGITITNGAGDGIGVVDFTITDNVVTGNHFLRVRGVVDDVAWLNANAHLPTTVTGNDVSGVTEYIIQNWDEDTSLLIDSNYLSSFLNQNTLGTYVYTQTSEANLRYIQYSEYGGTAPAFFLLKSTVQDAIDSAKVGDAIVIGAGSYTEDLTISTSSLTLSGNHAGVDARNRSATESSLTGSIRINGSADSTMIDGMHILEGATILGSKTGVYLEQGAAGITIQNTLFTRSGAVDGDSYRGIINAIGGNQTGLTIQRNSFSGWATGIYLNPGTSKAQILNNDLDGNYVGVSVDGPDSVTISGNSIANNVFEGIGFGPWSDGGNPAPDTLKAILTNNDFDGNTTHVGLYTGSGTSFDLSGNSFGGINAGSMSIDQLLEVEEKIGHEADASGGYSGFASLRDQHVFVTNGNSIATALGIVSNGWSVQVGAGSYDPFSIGLAGPSNLTVQGNGGSTISLDSSASIQRIVDLRADSITLSGFSIKGRGTHTGISVTGQSAIISNNTIDSVLTGIQTTTQYTEGNNTITGNTITNTSYGISLQNNSNTVTNNAITVSEEGFGIGSANNTITGNQITIGAGGKPLHTYSGGNLPGSDINITEALSNNTFNRAVIVKNTSGISVESIFGSIQEAVNSTETKDTVLVNPGSYSEQVTVSKKGVVLAGQAGVTLNVGRGETGITVSADSIAVQDLTIRGPYNLDYTAVDWDTMANAFGVVVSSNDVLVTNNTISDLRTGLSFVNGSSGTAHSNTIDNTKGSFLIRTDDLTITDNQPGETGSEWDIVFLTVSDGAYTTSPTTSELEYSRDLIRLSGNNGGMSVLDRRYGSNGFLGIGSTVGNRTHIYTSGGSTFTADDDFNLGNGLGNARQPLGSVEAGIDAVIIGGTIYVQKGTYTETTLSLDKDSLTIKILPEASGIDSLILDNTVTQLNLTGNDSTLAISGNSLNNTITVTGSNIKVNGSAGNDTLVVTGNRVDHSITENAGSFTLINNNLNTENILIGFEFVTFDDITVSLDFAEPVSYPGGSLSFSNNTASLSIPGDNSLDVTSSLSIEFWIKISGFTSNDQAIITKGSDTWSIHRSGNTDFIAFTTNHSGSSNTLHGNTSINDNQWHHIAVVFNGSDKSVFVDGHIDSTTSISGNLNTNNQPITIGGWTGNIDDLRFWSTALDSAQIRMNSYQQLDGNETGLEGYWRMDEGTGSLVGDLTSNTNNANIPYNSSISWSNRSHPVGTFITGDEGWRIITSPANGVTYGELLSGIWTQGFTGADTESGSPNVFTYSEGDGSTDASSRGFQSISSSSEVTTAGKAILIYIYEDNDPGTDGIQVGFPKDISTDSAQHSGEVAQSLSLTKSGLSESYDPVNDGWNMVGNPYAATLDWDAGSGWNRSGIDNSIYVWSDSANSGTGAYLSWNGVSGTLGSGKIAPMQGFWVKANNTGTPSFSVNDSARSSGAVLLKRKIVPEINLRVNGSGLSNTAIVMFSEQASQDKDPLDAYKLQSLNRQYLSLFTELEDGTGLDINALSTQFESSFTIPLGIDGSDLSGSFELSWSLKGLPDDLSITLIDTGADVEVDLTSASGYAFDFGIKSKTTNEKERGLPAHEVFAPEVLRSKKAVSASRFLIRIAKGTSVGSEPASDLPSEVELHQNYPNPFNPSTNIAFGIPETGKVTLEVFDILGRKVATLLNGDNKVAGRYTIHFDARNLASGMYIYRLRAGNTIITRKLTLIR